MKDRSMKKIIIPDGVTSIPDEAFKDCKDLEEIIISNSVIEIGNEAFSGCTKLKYIKLPENIKTIGNYAFKNCKKIPSLYIPASLTSIGYAPFSYMSSLEHIEVSSKNKKFKTYDNLSLIDKKEEALIQYAIGAKERSYEMPTIPPKKRIKYFDCGTARISELAFAGSKYLEDLSLSSQILYIEKTAFDECNNLKTMHIRYHPFATDAGFKIDSHNNENEYDKEKSVWNHHLISFPFENLIIENGLKSCNTRAFPAFKNLKKVELGNTMANFSHEVFSNSNNLKEIFIPNSVNTIMFNSFGKNQLLKFENGLEINSSDLNELYKKHEKEEKLYTLNNYNLFLVEKDNCIVKLKKEDIEQFKDDNGCRLDPDEIINYLAISRIFNNNSTLLKKKTFIKAFKDLPSISYPGSNDSKNPIIFENPKSMIRELMKMPKNQLKNSDSISTKLLKYFDKNMERMIYLASNLSQSYNIEKLLNLALILGAFEEDNVTRQKSLTFINERILTSKNGSVLNSNNITTALMHIDIRKEFDSEFAKFFMKNYEKIHATEIKFKGFIAKLYNIFPKIYENKNKEFDFIFEQLTDKRFSNVTKKTKELATFLGYYFNEENSFELATLFINLYDSNMKRMVKLSEVMKDYNTAPQNMEDLLTLSKVLGAFEEDNVIRQRALTFINDRILSSGVNSFKIIGDDIHRMFGDFELRDTFDEKYAKFFMENYDKLYDKEMKKAGFICDTYNSFPKISSAHTSDKGYGRKLKVTFEKCSHFLTTIKFKKINEKNKDLAYFIGDYFAEDETFKKAINVVEESKKAPRNIFSKFTTDNNNNTVFDNNPECDLNEELSDDFSYSWLPKQSYYNLLLGKLCNCCAHLNGAGFGIMRASMISKDHQNLVIKNSLGKIIAKSTIYINREKGYAVFNNIESSFEYTEEKDLFRIYKVFLRGAKAFMDKYNENNPNTPLLTINIGSSRNRMY